MFWSIARYDLRLLEQEFWCVTVRQFCLIQGRHTQALKRADWHAGIQASFTANYSQFRPPEWLSPADIMPSLRETNEPQPPSISPEDQCKLLGAAFRAMAAASRKPDKVITDAE